MRRVRNPGEIKWRGRLRHIGKAFVGQWIGLKGMNQSVQEVYLARQLIGTLHDQDLAGLRPASRPSTAPATQQKVSTISWH